MMLRNWSCVKYRWSGLVAYPSIQGAANWHSLSYTPKTNLFCQAAVEMGTIFYKGEARRTIPGSVSRAEAAARSTPTIREAPFAP